MLFIMHSIYIILFILISIICFIIICFELKISASALIKGND